MPFDKTTEILFWLSLQHNAYEYYRLREQKTAILIFAQSPLEDVKCKHLPKGEAIFDRLTHHTLSTVQKTGLPYYHFSEKQQVGHTFGERFSHAINAVFGLGYDSLITIGNDSPDLRKVHLLQTLDGLRAGNSVLGPSADGGFYLLGITKSQFQKLDFAGLPWQSPSLFRILSHELEGLGAVPLRLKTLFDLDDFQDLISFVQRSGTSFISLIRVITILLSGNIHSWFFEHILLENNLLSLPFNKGSPVLSFSGPV